MMGGSVTGSVTKNQTQKEGKQEVGKRSPRHEGKGRRG